MIVIMEASKPFRTYPNIAYIQKDFGTSPEHNLYGIVKKQCVKKKKRDAQEYKKLNFAWGEMKIRGAKFI